MPLLLQTFDRFAALDVERRTWLELAQGLLLVCRQRDGSAREWTSASPPSWVEDAFVAIAAQALRLMPTGGPSAFVDLALVAQLRALGEAELTSMSPPGSLSEGVVAHGLALAIDHYAGQTFVETFRSNLRAELRPGDPYPLAPHDPRGWLGGRSANTRPDRLPTRRLDRIPHLRLADDRHSRYGVVLDFDMWNHLAPLSAVEGLCIATVHPNLTLDEFQIVEETRDGRRLVRNLGPRSPDTQHDVLVRAVGMAVDRGAEVVVLPEYCLAADERERFQNAVDGLPGQPLLLVAATSEVMEAATGGYFHNEAWVSVPGPPGASVDGRRARGFGLHKIFAAEIDHAAEGIAGATNLVIVKSESVTLAVLTCRDASSDELIDLLADCGVNLLLVPAFSDRTGSIVGLATGLSTRSQAFVAVAVAPAQWLKLSGEAMTSAPADRAEAAFSAPYEHPPVPVVVPAPDAPRGEGAGLWLFDVPTRSVEWVDV
ncbi:hypothetical protein [Candidatus Blastococcus massiliensis]|uniref:hypothetical protein n=1 Tax=Candidatus Blastococcus massiliensis TaxID=1470358 RepID=UPI0004B5A388|nr:hypothetical protein [Candidatus Blastococcus massiliensis]